MSQQRIFDAYRSKFLNLLKEDRPALARDHFENVAKVVFDKSYSLYNELFNKIRAIDGITIVSVNKSAKDFGPDRKTVMLSIKYIPAKNNLRSYETFVANEVRRIDGIHSCRFIGRAKRTQTDYQKKAGIDLDHLNDPKPTHEKDENNV